MTAAFQGDWKAEIGQWLRAAQDCVLLHLIGSAAGYRDGSVYLARHRAGAFFHESWRHVSGVLLLDLVRLVDEPRYVCTVITNPNATHGIDPAWFPRGRVCVLDGDRFVWVGGEPGQPCMLSTGTRLVDALP
jgi:hypothetical protein